MVVPNLVPFELVVELGAGVDVGVGVGVGADASRQEEGAVRAEPALEVEAAHLQTTDVVCLPETVDFVQPATVLLQNHVVLLSSPS